MKKGQIENLLTLILAWTVYGLCQNDIILPAIASLIIFVSFLREIKNEPSLSTSVDRKIPWVNLIGIAYLLGWLWRNTLPDPDFVSLITPRIVFIMQTTLVFLSLFVWFRHNYYQRSYALRFLAWMIVTLSINVKFDQITLIVFWIFCFLSTGFILIKPHVQPVEEKNKKRKSRPLTPAVYITIFSLITLGMFTSLVHLVKLGDRVFLHIIQDYFLSYKHHFLSFNSTLSLHGPGYSGRDVRPVLEIDRHKDSHLYLATQVFENYENGTWQESKNIAKYSITNNLDPEKPTIEMIMFDYLENIIPAHKKVSGVKSYQHTFEQDENRIIYSTSDDVLKVSFALNDLPLSKANVNEKKKEALTQLPMTLKTGLKPHMDAIVANEQNPYSIAQKIETHFKNNFDYALDIYYPGNDKGILAMLKERRPAYCSYFASAMALMLRERNIPSRLKVGFYASETIDKGKKFLVRVRDAHAWVEALLPNNNAPNEYHWVRFDPTPAAARLNLLNLGRPLNPWADWLWRAQKRLRSEMVSMNATDLVIKLLYFILAFILIRNRKEVIQNFKDLLQFKKTAKISVNDDLAACIKIYQSFENVLQKAFGLTRKDTETDEELVMRIREEEVTSPETISFIESFLNKYHAVRFGRKHHQNLEEHLRAIKGKIVVKH